MRFFALQGYHGVSSTLAGLFRGSDAALCVQDPIPVAQHFDREVDRVHVERSRRHVERAVDGEERFWSAPAFVDT